MSSTGRISGNFEYPVSGNQIRYPTGYRISKKVGIIRPDIRCIHRGEKKTVIFQVTSTKFTRELKKEVMISAVASIFMGFGTLFLLLWVGIFV
jgi:hypothetical protein